MRTVSRLVFIGLIAAARLAPQTVDVYSEFLRVNPRGEILAADATPKPREILSPAVVRNGFASFQIVVRSPRPTSYFLFVSSHLANIFRMEIYKEKFVKRGAEWFPDELELVRSPNFEAIPDGEAGIPGQSACAYLLDIWVPPDTPLETVRVEVQMKVGTWVIRPMEVRILPARVPAIVTAADALPPIEQSAGEAVMGPVLGYLGNKSDGPLKRNRTPPRTLREAIRRNAEQDMALARALDAKTVAPVLSQKIETRSNGGEWYLGIRDFIYRLSR
jgi:hypothetical protein